MSYSGKERSPGLGTVMNRGLRKALGLGMICVCVVCVCVYDARLVS